MLAYEVIVMLTNAYVLNEKTTSNEMVSLCQLR